MLVESSLTPDFTISGLMADGVHYGHRVSKWNPLMAEYIFCKRNGVHIIDLTKTASLLSDALSVIKETARRHGRILFVCTKPEAREIVEREATRCGQYYINTRWLGGTLTNWQTVSRSIRSMSSLEKELVDPDTALLKKERMKKNKKLQKMHVVFNGIKTMGNKADLICIIGVNKDGIAVAEARKIGIPIIGILDTDCNPLGIDYPVPGNDDSLKSIETYMQLWANAVLSGMTEAAAPKSTNDNKPEHKKHSGRSPSSTEEPDEKPGE